MTLKNIVPKNTQIIIGIIFFLLAVVLIIIIPSTIKNPISVDYDKKTFSGTLPVLLIIASVVFFWFGSKEKKDELGDAKRALKEATDNLNGRIVNLNFRFGPDSKQEQYKNSLKLKTLAGTYSVRNKGDILKTGSITFYEDPDSKCVMAEFRDIPFHDDHFIVFEIKDGASTFSGSESLKIRIANLN